VPPGREAQGRVVVEIVFQGRDTMHARLAGVVCILALTASALHAASPQRTFVRSNGNDANPCSLVLPCRSFDVALGIVAPAGEVLALDSAGYGAMTIAQPVSVIAPPGVHAAITVSGTTAVTISAAPGSPVTLRGLAISNLTAGGSGIDNAAGAALRIENCSVDGFALNVNHAGPGTLHIADSRLTRGVLSIMGSGGTASFSVERTYLSPGPVMPFTMFAGSGSRGTVKDSTIEGSGLMVGIHASTNTAVPAPVAVFVENSTIQNLGGGVLSDAGGGSTSSVSVSNSQLLGNQIAITALDGGTVSLVSSRVAHNVSGATNVSAGGPIYTDGRNWFGYNGVDLEAPTTLTGPAGLR
jgi:hypothetical protein